MKPLVIFGCGDFAQVACRYFTVDSQYEVVAFTADADRISQPMLFGKDICPFEDLEKHFPSDECSVFVAVGYSKINRARRAVLERCRAKGYTFASYLSSKAIAIGPLELGEHTFIFESNVLQPFVTVGNNVILWSGNHVGHHSAIEDDCFVAGHVIVSGGVRIGRGTFIGVNATIADRVCVGQENILGAGSLIMKNTKDGEVYRGARSRPDTVTSLQLWG